MAKEESLWSTRHTGRVVPGALVKGTEPVTEAGSQGLEEGHPGVVGPLENAEGTEG